MNLSMKILKMLKYFGSSFHSWNIFPFWQKSTFFFFWSVFFCTVILHFGDDFIQSLPNFKNAMEKTAKNIPSWNRFCHILLIHQVRHHVRKLDFYLCPVLNQPFYHIANQELEQNQSSDRDLENLENYGSFNI